MSLWGWGSSLGIPIVCDAFHNRQDDGVLMLIRLNPGSKRCRRDLLLGMSLVYRRSPGKKVAQEQDAYWITGGRPSFRRSRWLVTTSNLPRWIPFSLCLAFIFHAVRVNYELELGRFYRADLSYYDVWYPSVQRQCRGGVNGLGEDRGRVSEISTRPKKGRSEWHRSIIHCLSILENPAAQSHRYHREETPLMSLFRC